MDNLLFFKSAHFSKMEAILRGKSKKSGGKPAFDTNFFKPIILIYFLQTIYWIKT